MNIGIFNNIKSDFSYILVGLLLLFMSKPYFVWFNPYMAFCTIFFVLWGCFSLFHRKLNLKELLFVIAYVILSYVNSLIGNLNTYGLISSLIFPLMIFIPASKRIRMLFNFTKIYAVLIFLSLIVFFLVYIFNFNIPSGNIESLNVLKDYTYKIYPLLSMPDARFLILPRFPAFFDEPGVVGTISLLLLITFGKDLNKFYYVSILLSGIFSFSLYFYVTYIFYLFTIIDAKRIILSLVLFLLLLFVFPPFQGYFDSYIKDRLEIKSDGSFEGDNRTSKAFDSEYNNFLSSSLLFYGKGDSFISSGACSYKTIIYSRGLVFFISIFSLYFLYAFFKLRKIRSLYLFFLIFLGITYQRPFYFDPFYFFILLTIVDYFQLKDNLKFTNYVSDN